MIRNKYNINKGDVFMINLKKGMSKKEILGTVKMLAQFQGMYGTLLSILEQNEDALEYLEGQNFKDEMDFILLLALSFL
jgi:hypothetical protein